MVERTTTCLKNSLLLSCVAGPIAWILLLGSAGWNHPIQRITERIFPNFGINNGDLIVLLVAIVSAYFFLALVTYTVQNTLRFRIAHVVVPAICILVWNVTNIWFLDVKPIGSFTLSAVNATIAWMLMRDCVKLDPQLPIGQQ